MNKEFLATILIFFTSISLFAQDRDFDGLWKGVMEKTNGEKFNLTLYIEDNNVYSVTKDEDGDPSKDRQFEVVMSKGFGQQLNFFWINKGGVWTETQMFSISYNSSTELSVYMTRHVSNASDDVDGNTDWGYFATGILE